MKRKVLFIFMALITPVMMAKQATVVGNVFDALQQRAVPDCSVTLTEDSTEVVVSQGKTTVVTEAGILRGEISDPMLELGLSEANVFVMTPDSTVVDSTLSEYNTITEKREMNGIMATVEIPDFNVPAYFCMNVKEGSYILKIVKRGYDTYYKNIDVQFSSRETIHDVGEIWLTREAINLGEVTVRGTLLKVIYKGDTLVYNASAFQTSEGDMLGNLIEKLPGAEIKEGRISVNGRFVESLLINGKDFFNGDVEQALRSLPAFTVKKIKTYDKAGEMSETTGYDMHDKQFVMDVELKRQYDKTWIGSLDAMGGTQGRYNILGSLMRVDSRLSFCFVGEANNVNRKVDAYDGRREGTYLTGDGIHYSQAAYATLRYEPNSKLKLGATASLRHLRDYTGVSESSETFLPSNNTFGRSISKGKNTATQLRAEANLTLRPKQGLYFRGDYKVQYEHSRSTALEHSASFLTRPDSLFGENVLDYTFSLPTSSELLQKWVLQRLQQESLRRNNYMLQQLNVKTQKAFGANLLSITGGINYNSTTNKTFNLYSLSYPHSGESDDYRHRFYDSQAKSLNYSAGVSYIYKYVESATANGQLKPYYSFAQTYNNNENPLYRLDRIEEQSAVIDALPSTRGELLSTLDNLNTSYARQHNTNHEVGVELIHEFRLANHSWALITATLPFNLRFNRMNYDRNNLSYYVSRVSRHLNPEISIRWRPAADDRSGKKSTLKLTYATKGEVSGLYDLLSIEDSNDPLNIRLGNPALNDARSHKATLSYTVNWAKHASSLDTKFSFLSTTDAIAVSRTYDEKTGVSTSKPVNIDGNWRMAWDNYYTVALDKAQKLFLTLNTNCNLQHSKDLNSWSGNAEERENVVYTSNAGLNVRLRYLPTKKWDITVSLIPSLSRISGESSDFTTINAWQMGYSLETSTVLPFDFVLHNKLDISSRYGYADESLCDTRFIWDASLERNIAKDLSLEIMACDLLRDNRRSEATINSQGRVERYYRMLPAYFMVGLHWNFTKLISNK